MSLLELFCEVDDFYRGFALWAHKQQLTEGKKCGPKCRLSESEVMTIMTHFHESGYRNSGLGDLEPILFKSYYQKHVCRQLRGEFPGLVSYSRFVELTSEVLLPLCAYLQASMGETTGISFVDSTHLAVCHRSSSSTG